MALLQDIINYFNRWIPSDIAWEKDNTGLQLGDPKQKVSKVLLALDCTEKVLSEAIEKKFNLIITHHPFLFKPISALNFQNPESQLIQQAIKNDISIYSAHTNLDFVFGGVSTVLAEKLGLANISFLKPHQGYDRKLVVFVPKSHVKLLVSTLSEAGAGTMGHYDSCSFQLDGKGTFRGNEQSKPVVGKAGVLEKVDEIRLEMTYPSWKESAILQALRKVHPYEEIAFDLYSLANQQKSFGFGAKGELPEKLKLSDWLSVVKKNLNAQAVRYAGDLSQTVHTVAVCGGSCSELISLAKRSDVDCFITADLKYHSFFETHSTFSLIDAGHFETEYVVLSKLKNRLSKEFLSTEFEITTVNTNPILFY